MRANQYSNAICRGGTSFTVEEVVRRSPTVLVEPCSLGLVVGTFASVPYVHLQLEARRRFYPHVKMLVHDDASPVGRTLERLCLDYNADFETNEVRCTPFLGDLTAFLGGLVWARANSLDLLLKLSRRFLPVCDWTASLIPLAIESQYPTYCSWTKTFNFGFRSECVAMAVKEWWRLMLVDEIAMEVAAGGEPFVEAYVHNLARRAARFRCSEARVYDDRVGHRPRDKDGYACWSLMGTDRMTRSESFLWHNWAKPAEYHALGQQWGLPYSLSEYVDPNQGFGNRR
jgi:hypothetical protein